MIIYLNEEYTQIVIGRNKRDYVWIMARTPVIPESDYRRIVEQLAAAGYDTKRIQRVPQRWPENGTKIRSTSAVREAVHLFQGSSVLPPAS